MAKLEVELLLSMVMPLLLVLGVAAVSPVARQQQIPHGACSRELNVGDIWAHHHFNSSSPALRLPLHHPRSPCSPAPYPADLPFSAVLTHDAARAHYLSAHNDRLSSSIPTLLLHDDYSSAKAAILRGSARATGAYNVGSSGKNSVPLTPGKAVGVGNYVTRINLGTPPASYVTVLDTGSSLSWLQCQPCVISCHDQTGPVYDPSSSSTFRSLSCSSNECNSLQSATLNPSACSRSNICIYQASYGDSSFSLGYLSEDALSFGGATFPSFVYGCGQDNEGLFGQSDGLIGMARNKLSLFYQLAPRLGYSFSYCLPSANGGSGYLSIGAYNSARFSYTPMASSSDDASLYFVKVARIVVAGSPLSVSSEAYMSLPTIIDSGTVVTRMPSAVIDALGKAVAGALQTYPRAQAYSILDTCFKGSVSTMPVPEVDLVFEGGATMKLPPKNVLIDVDGGTTCLAFAAATSTAIIGNTQQQGFSVVYDVGQSKIGFAAGGCS